MVMANRGAVTGVVPVKFAGNLPPDFLEKDVHGWCFAGNM
jgi:hypothetical protein